MIQKIFLAKENLKYNPHPWLFSGAIENKNKNLKSGEIVDLFFKDEFVARGYFNSKTSIAFRKLTDKQEEINTDFFYKRFTEQQIFINNIIDKNITNCYRLVYGENSFLPGLVVDIYDDVIVVQFHTAGVDNLKNNIVEALIKLFNPVAIFNKSDIQSRKLEGLELIEEQLYGKPIKEKIVKENNILFKIDFEKGQKTGTFLDQRDNRLSVLKYFKNGELLNLFGYNGGFNLYLKNIKNCNSICADISEEALRQFEENLKLNNMSKENHKSLKLDIFKSIDNNNLFDKKFDAIIVDPPALAKSLNQKDIAVKQYINLNRFALKNLKSGGFLFSSSCTSIIKQTDFEYIIYQAALKEKVKISILEKRLNSSDHPINPFFDEGTYLKFYVIYKY